MSTLHKIPFLTEQDYLTYELTADCRHEYLDGQIYAMAGAGERHNRIGLNIAFHLRAPTSGVFVNDMKLRIDQGRAYYYPDVMLVCDSRDGEDNYKQSPCFIAEVLSQSTEITDRRKKCLAYQKIPSLRYYLLASSDRMHAEYFQRDQSGDWQTAMLEPGETLIVECEGYRAVLTLNDIYEDVVFD